MASADKTGRPRAILSLLVPTPAERRLKATVLPLADTSTPTGEAMANMLPTFAQFERRLISQRTREALAIKRANGVRLGRPPTVPQTIVRIQRQRDRGDSLRAIAESLNRDNVPTAQGGARWHAATVRGILARSA